jgi:hypothetical protein
MLLQSLCGLAKNMKTRCERGARMFIGRLAVHTVHESGMMLPGFDDLKTYPSLSFLS